ncbi:MAG: hypothetical protein JXR91_11570, partial [Deltaproteobacteria bacterium]|nr:hypothetical protein [Deltaproteobacteria bacterium]
VTAYAGKESAVTKTAIIVSELFFIFNSSYNLNSIEFFVPVFLDSEKLKKVTVFSIIFNAIIEPAFLRF